MKLKIGILFVVLVLSLASIIYGQSTIVAIGHVSEPVLPSWIPHKGGLIGWYKIDEGSGTIVKNYATTSPRLSDVTLVGNPVTFWNLSPPGIGLFGVSNPPGNTNYLSWTNSVPCITLDGNNKTRSMFVRIQNWPAGFLGRVAWFMRENIDTDYDGIPSDSVSLNVAVMSHGLIDQNPNNSLDTARANVENRWIFLFNLVDTRVRPRIILDDGTMVSEVVFGGVGVGPNLPIRRINIFGRPNPFTGLTYFDGIVADLMIWEGIALNINDFRTVYNNLRGRYNMAVPSGW